MYVKYMERQTKPQMYKTCGFFMINKEDDFMASIRLEQWKKEHFWVEIVGFCWIVFNEFEWKKILSEVLSYLFPLDRWVSG